MDGTNRATSLKVSRLLDEKKRCRILVINGTITACPMSKIKSAVFPRPMARNPIKLINNRGRDLNAKRSVERIPASIGIPTVLSENKFHLDFRADIYFLPILRNTTQLRYAD